MAKYNFNGIDYDFDEYSEAECLEVVRKDGWMISCVPNEVRTEEMLIAAVHQQPWVIGYVCQDSEEVCLTAVKQDGTTLKKVATASQSEAVCLAAVTNTWRALEYVRNQTEALCLVAARQNKRAILDIHDKGLQLKVANIMNIKIRQ